MSTMQTFYFKNWQECLAETDFRDNLKTAYRYTIIAFSIASPDTDWGNVSMRMAVRKAKIQQLPGHAEWHGLKV